MILETRNGLAAPAEFWKLTKAELKELVNGCGPKGYDYLIPDTVYGLSITRA